MEDPKTKRRDYMTAYKAALRQDPERDAAYKAQAREYARKRREGDPELRQRERDAARERARIKRLEPKTREQVLATRDYQRNYQRLSRLDPNYVERGRYYQIKARFGLSVLEYNALFDKHAGHCHVCRRPLLRGTGQSAIDHCHKTGKVRGLLCGGCNKGMGMFGDDADRLRAAADYLDKSGEQG